MAKNKHRTTHPTTGQTATRTSASKIYTHAVWAQEPAELQRERDERQLADYRNTLARYEAVVASGVTDSKYTTIEDYTDRFIPGLQGDVAKLEAKLAGAYTDKAWGCVTWCGRPDLADKQAAKWAKGGWRVVITEAELV